MNLCIRLDFKKKIICSDSKENCYVMLLKYLVNNGYEIDGMKRTASGNSHDENSQDEYTVIADGGPFADKFEAASKQ